MSSPEKPEQVESQRVWMADYLSYPVVARLVEVKPVPTSEKPLPPLTPVE